MGCTTTGDEDMLPNTTNPLTTVLGSTLTTALCAEAELSGSSCTFVELRGNITGNNTECFWDPTSPPTRDSLVGQDPPNNPDR
jgi:hypothetical protein